MTLIFFPVKAEMLPFSNLMTGGPRGDLQRVNFSLNINMSTKIFRISKNFKVKFTLCKSPRGAPSSNFKKVTSQLSLEKIIMSQLSQIDFYLNSKHGIGNSPTMCTLASRRAYHKRTKNVNNQFTLLKIFFRCQFKSPLCEKENH